MQRKQSKTPIGVLLAAFAFAVGAQAQTVVIPTTYAYPSSAADTSKPGFTWRIHQVTSSQGNSNARTEQQLAGLLGQNVADPNAQGIAIAPAAPPSPDTAPISFEIASVINLAATTPSSGDHYGNFGPDDPMPGMPGTGTDYAAAEILMWLDLPAGDITMGVNSDDGFRMTIGGPSPTDQFAAIKVGEFEGGRGADDTIFTFKIQQAGLYAVRITWENGGGDSNIEFFWVKSDGAKDLVNAGQIKAYRAITVPTKAYVSKAVPGRDATGVAPTTLLLTEITDGGTAIDPATVKLSLDGAQLTATATKSGSVTTITNQPAKAFAAGSKHQLTVSYTEGTQPVTLSWSFTVAGYAIITPDLKVTADTTKPGFVWNVFANQANQVNTTRRAENALAGLLKDPNDGSTLPNLADPNAKGPALATASAPSPANSLISFEIPGVLNLSHTEGENNGNFGTDDQMPGLPATDTTRDGVSAEIITYLDLPAGIITMGVNSDDNFKTYVGQDIAKAVQLGETDVIGGHGAADALFNFEVKEAGVYPFRTVYEQGNAAASIEWFTVKPDGTKVLINNTAGGGVKAYRALSGTVPPYVRMSEPPTTPRQLNQVATNLTIVLQDATTPVDVNSIELKLNGKAATVNKTRMGKEVVVTYQPDTLFVPDQVQTAELTYKDTGSFTRTAQWKFRNLKAIILPATPAIAENFDSYAEGSVPTGWTASNFTDCSGSFCQTPGEDLTDLESDSFKGWIVMSRANLETLKSRIFNWFPGTQIFNGVAVESLSEGNVLYAESDVRDGNQVQFIISKPFDLSNVTNVVLTFSSLYEQNQDNIDALEYSVDKGTNWLPLIYYIDFESGGGDIKLNPDGSVNATSTFTDPNSDTARWTDNGVAKGGKYIDAIAAPLSDELGNYVAPRDNDDQQEGKRIEVLRLPLAGKKSDVRLRFAQIGTASWYWGVDNIAFYEGPPPATPAVGGTLSISVVGANSVSISWTGTGTLEQADTLGGSWTAAPSQLNPQTVQPSGTKFYRVRQ